MSFLGMNIDQVSEQVDRIQAGQQRLQDLTTRLAGTVARSADSWVGPDADSFRAAWASTSTSLHSAGQQLESRGSELAQHRDEQDAASEGGERSGGAGSGGPSAPDGGPSAPDGGPSAQDPVDKTNAPGDPAYYGTVDPEVEDLWVSLSGPEREAVARAILEEELERYGIEGVPVDFDLKGGNGLWSFTGEDGHAISINGDELHTPRLLHTLAHEARHAAQWEAVQDTEPGAFDWLPFVDSTADDYERLEEEHGFTREEIDSWRDYWNTPKDERPPYLDRPIEVDARNAGAEYSNELTKEDLHRYMDASGVEYE